MFTMFTLSSVSSVVPSKMSLSSETVDTLTEENNTAEDKDQGQNQGKGQDQGQKEEEGEEVQRFSYEVDPDIGVIV